MAAGYGYWAAGGQHGDLMLTDLKIGRSTGINTAPGSTINNGICFSRGLNNEIRILVSNNDGTLRVFSTPDLRLVETLDFRTAVNHTSVSPNGRKMISVGDDNRVCLFDISYTGRFELVQSMAVSKDANFSIAWNHSSDKFAVSSQDGSVHVWDIRHSNPIAKFKGLNVSFF
ncbi:hypothetical protein G6F56_001086 [Rhizopus delemar]|nr:hypothetical protein G6F56_001086 [Rhizopus delemar]